MLGIDFEFDPIKYQFVAAAQACSHVTLGTALDRAVVDWATAERTTPLGRNRVDDEFRAVAKGTNRGRIPSGLQQLDFHAGLLADRQFDAHRAGRSGLRSAFLDHAQEGEGNRILVHDAVW